MSADKIIPKYSLIVTVSIASFLIWKLVRSKKVKNVAKVSNLYVYPIKSVQGLEVGTAEVTRNGMKYGVFRDRQMILINAENRMITQRQEPRLCLIQVTMSGPTELTLTADGYEPLKVVPITEDKVDKERIRFNVWSSPTEGVEVDENVSKWFSNFLGQPGVKLVQHLKDFRMRPSRVASKSGGYQEEKYAILYQDGDPVLLASNNTLDELNTKITDEIKMSQKNFRPNIVIEGCPPLIEETWNSVFINGLQMKNIKLCTRCQIPTINIETAQKIEGRAELLKRFRSAQNDHEKKNYGSDPLFGVNILPLNEGFVSVGFSVDAI